MDGGWCILRTSGRFTLRLAQGLAADGIEAWTPTVTRRVTVPRMNAKRDVVLPLLPGFVFAPAQHLWQLVDRSEDPRQCVGFSVFRHLDRYPVIRDRQLDPLRNEERRSVPKDRMQVYGKGEEVLVLPIADGAASVFGGMSGSVLRSNEKKTLVLMGGSRRVEFFTFDLQPIERIRPANSQRAPRHRHAVKYLGQKPNVGKPLSEKCEACNDDAGREAVGTATRP